MLDRTWCWPNGEEINDFPDPLGIEEQWSAWPGPMAEGPSVFAEIFSREYIQNSWDSIQAKRESMGPEDGAAPAITFQFVELSEERAHDFREALGLDDHRNRLEEMTDEEYEDQRLGDTVLTDRSDEPLRLLIASERCGLGMAGRWSTEGAKDVAESSLRVALIQSTTGEVKMGKPTGGSWGQGKKGVASASRIRTLAAYTCHPAHEDEEGVTRQFLGVSYWRPHTSADWRHRGLGLLGLPEEGSDGSGGGSGYRDLRPYRNEEADGIIDDLDLDQLRVRNPDDVADHGTSYLFIDPAFSPEDLAWAIGRNWWPLLDEHEVDIEVFDYDGGVVDIPTREREELRPFIECFDICIGRDSSSSDTTAKMGVDAQSIEAGTLVTKVDLSDGGWSYEDPEENANIVALVRNDMVIAYQRSPAMRRTRPPFVRGAFLVSTDSDASRILKMTEGHLHNSWKEDPDEVGNTGYAKFAQQVLKKIHAAVKEMRQRFETAEAPSRAKIRAFQLIFSGNTRVTGATGGAPSGSGPREYVREFGAPEREYSDSDPTSLRMEVTATICLRPDHPEEAVWYRLEPGWSVKAESTNRDQALLDRDSIEAPDGFAREGEYLEGKLTKEPIEVTWRSDFFPDTWLVEPSLRAKPLGGGSS